MKKLFSLFVVLSLVLCAFAGCGGDSTDTTASTDKATVTGTTTDAATDASTDAATDAATEDSVQLAGDEIFKFEFSSDAQVKKWKSGNASLYDMSIVDGAVECTILGADPFIQTSIAASKRFDTAEVKTIELKVKNNTRDTKGQLMYVTTDENSGSYIDNKPIEINYTQSGASADWEIITITLADLDLPQWKGKLGNVRFDLVDTADSGTFSIEYISFKK